MATIMARSRRSPAGSGGYTLTELLVVLTIMGLMAALGPPLLGSARQHVVARAAVYRLAARLQAAHERAVDTQSVVCVPPVIFYPDGSASAPVIHYDGATILVAPFSGRVDVEF